MLISAWFGVLGNVASLSVFRQLVFIYDSGFSFLRSTLGFQGRQCIFSDGKDFVVNNCYFNYLLEFEGVGTSHAGNDNPRLRGSALEIDFRSIFPASP